MLLLIFSYLTNFVRMGSLVVLIHDPADVFLEAAKMCHYVHTHGQRTWASTAADAFFYVFAITFFISRLVIFPFWVLYSTIYEAPETLGSFPAYYLFNGLLVLL